MFPRVGQTVIGVLCGHYQPTNDMSQDFHPAFTVSFARGWFQKPVLGQVLRQVPDTHGLEHMTGHMAKFKQLGHVVVKA